MQRAELLKVAKPILFNTEMVMAILEGRKTVTRRLVKPQQVIGLGCDKCPNNMPEEYIKQKEMLFKPWCDMSDNELISAIYKPPYQPGDILYVRETWNHYVHDVVGGSQKGYHEEGYFYKASPEMKSSLPSFVEYHLGEKWKPSIHMPKEAARIFLKVTDVRVERLQDICGRGTPQDHVTNIAREGVQLQAVMENYQKQMDDFKQLWNSTIKKSDCAIYGWDANPWVWVIEFEVITAEQAKASVT